MTEAQFVALLGMLMIGAFGLVFTDSLPDRYQKPFAIVWGFLWLTPPLTMLWLKGVLG